MIISLVVGGLAWLGSENSTVDDGDVAVHHPADWSFLLRSDPRDLGQLLQPVHHGPEDQAELEILVLHVGDPDHELGPDPASPVNCPLKPLHPDGPLVVAESAAVRQEIFLVIGGVTARPVIVLVVATSHVIVYICYQGEIPKEGQYTHQLLQLASPPPGSDMKDSNLCPNFT